MSGPETREFFHLFFSRVNRTPCIQEDDPTRAEVRDGWSHRPVKRPSRSTSGLGRRFNWPSGKPGHSPGGLRLLVLPASQDAESLAHLTQAEVDLASPKTQWSHRWSRQARSRRSDGLLPSSQTVQMDFGGTCQSGNRISDDVPVRSDGCFFRCEPHAHCLFLMCGLCGPRGRSRWTLVHTPSSCSDRRFTVPEGGDGLSSSDGFHHKIGIFTVVEPPPVASLYPAMDVLTSP